LTRTIARTAVLAAVLAAGRAAAAPIPQAPRGRPADYEASEALFARAGFLQPMIEATERWQYEGLRPYQELTVGSYARVERHLKVGAFYRLQYGARHDDDWKFDGPGRWSWRDTTRRPESLLVLDVTPRTELGRGWVGSVKTRWEHDFFNEQNSLIVAPELAWFWLDGLTPRGTLFLRYETWLPMNFGETTEYERWWYAAFLWHARPWLSLGPEVALRDEVWTTSSEFRSRNPGADYKVWRRSWVPGFSVVARLP